MALFTGNVNLLIAAPMLQDLLVDKDGTAMAGGTITCYHDNSRTTLKNWYYQTGSPGNYTYTALPNPLTLSAAGTISDLNGVDTIPFFYPYSEVNDTVKDPYYITIVNHTRTNQITRENFPFVPPNSGNENLINSYTNLIVNNGFWRNLSPSAVTGTPTSIVLNSIMTLSNGLYSVTVAPSQHDGFRYHDIQFFKNNINASDFATFTPFPLNNSQPVVNVSANVPEYYLNHASNANGMSAETVKYYQFPIALHVNSLANVPFTVSIQAQDNGSGGTGTNVMTLQILQDTGTGTTSPAPFTISQVTLDSSWTQYSFTSIFPPTSGLTLGAGNDDGLYLLVSLPVNLNISINFTKPSIYLTNNSIPSYDYQSYDYVNSIISSPRTADVRITVNPFYNQSYQWVYGWVPMNDGVIGLNAMSVVSTTTQVGYVRANGDTWKLFNLLWSLAQPYDSGSNFNPICQIFTNTGTALTATNFGSTAYADFSANKALQLTKMFGRTIMGGAPPAALQPFYQNQSIGVTASNSSGNILFTPTAIAGFWQGAPIHFILTAGGSYPGNIVPNAIYYVTNISGGTFQVSTTYAGAIAGTGLVAWSSAGSNVYVNFNYPGVVAGEYTHTQLTKELATHAHGALPPATGFAEFTGAGTFGGAAGSSITQISTTGSQGTSTPFNIVDPVVFYFILIKL